MGAIARTAECAGVHAIVIPAKGSAQINPDAIKTSAGALYKIPVCRHDNFMQTVRFLQESGLQLVCCTEKTKDDIYVPDYTAPTAIIMGSEEDGIRNEIIRISDHLAKIPMFGEIESLNVSVSTGVILYEAIRQRTATPAP
jgi:23S rRNA (guanosine2251-2'-O)-methyltransferase